MKQCLGKTKPFFRFKWNICNHPVDIHHSAAYDLRFNVSISVYAYKAAGGQEGLIYPLKVSKEMNELHVNLLLIADDDTNHYCFINDFGKLVGSQYSSATDKHIPANSVYTDSQVILHLEVKHSIEELNFQMIIFSSLRIYKSRLEHHLQFVQIFRAF